MKKEKTKTGKILKALLTAVLVLAFAFTACSSPDDDSDSEGGPTIYIPPQRGLITIGNLPSGWVISYCYVSSNSSYQFTQYNGYVSQPSDNNWKISSVGRGNRIAYDKLEIIVEKYINMNGSYVRDDTQYNTNFNYTGFASVYLYFEGCPEGVSTSSFGVNNVTFSNGNATINFNDIYGSNNDPGNNSDPGNNNDPGLTNEIDASLYGTWVDQLDGNTLTLTISNSDIIWGGSAGSIVQDAVQSVRNQGYTVYWVAANGQIIYKYSVPGQTTQEIPLYGYRIQGDNFILTASSYDLFTLNKQ